MRVRTVPPDPCYVDTFEPEEQIDLKTAIMDYQKAIGAENKVEKELNEILNKLL